MKERLEKLVGEKGFERNAFKVIFAVSVSFVIVAMLSFAQSYYHRKVTLDLERNNFIFVNFVELEKLHSDMETGYRGFMLGGKKLFLTPYVKADKKRSLVIESIYKKTGSNYELEKLFRKVEHDFRAWDRFASERINQLKSGELKLNEVESDLEGKQLFDKLRSSSQKFKDNIGTKIKASRKRFDEIELYASLVHIFMLIMLTIALIKFFMVHMKNLTRDYRRILKESEENNEKLEKASRSKDLFLANMSHEVRTPLGAIIGFADLLAKDKSVQYSSDSRSYITFIQRSANHLLNLVNDLFDISKVEAQKIQLDKKKIDSRQFIDDVEDFFASKVNDKKILLDFKVSDKFPLYFYSDPTRLKQIVLNLIGNAVKFTPEKGKVKAIFTVENDCLNVDVIDQGIGIDKNIQENIFTPFVQGDLSHAREFGGAGLGLAISHKLALALGGSVELVSSKTGIGSHFRLKVELGKKVSSEFIKNYRDKKEEKNLKTKEPVDKSTYNFENKKILIVEDTKENQILLKIYLELTKASIEIVENGSDAVRMALGNNDFDIILMDIQMPGMDGYEAVRILRNSNYKGAIVAITAHTMKGEKEKCLNAGFDDYISKPVTQPTLLKKVKDVLTTHQDFDSESHNAH